MAFIRQRLFLDAEMPFNRADAFKRVVNFLAKAGDVLNLLAQIVEVTTDGLQFTLNAGQLSGEIRDIILRRHLAFDAGDFTSISPMSSLVAMWSTTCVSILPSSLSVVSSAVIRWKCTMTAASR